MAFNAIILHGQVGSAMTNIGHFRAVAKLLAGQRDIPVKLWVAPPTKMDQSELSKEGHYAIFGAAGARTAHDAVGVVNKDGAAIYKYMNFDQIEEYADTAKAVAATA